MISARFDRSIDGQAARLAARAKVLAEARASELALQRRSDPRRWRLAGLVWPLFGRK